MTHGEGDSKPLEDDMNVENKENKEANKEAKLRTKKRRKEQENE